MGNTIKITNKSSTTVIITIEEAGFTTDEVNYLIRTRKWGLDKA
jgi:hypothetical protein